MRHSHDRPAAFGERGVEMFDAIDGHSSDGLLGSESAHQQEVHEHAPVVLKGPPRDARDLWVRGVAAEDRSIVVQSRPALAGAEPEPSGPTGRRRGVPELWRKYAQQARTNAVTTAEQRQSRTWC